MTMEAGKPQQMFRDERKRSYLNAEGSDKPLFGPAGHDTLKRPRACRNSRVRGLPVATGCMFMTTGDRPVEQMNVWAGEICDLMREFGGGKTRTSRATTAAVLRKTWWSAWKT